MKFFKKPRVLSYDFPNKFNLNGNLTYLNLNLQNWGLIRIFSKAHSQWKGIHKFIRTNDGIFSFIVPKNSSITVKFINIFGAEELNFISPHSNYAIKDPQNFKCLNFGKIILNRINTSDLNQANNSYIIKITDFNSQIKTKFSKLNAIKKNISSVELHKNISVPKCTLEKSFKQKIINSDITISEGAN